MPFTKISWSTPVHTGTWPWGLINFSGSGAQREVFIMIFSTKWEADSKSSTLYVFVPVSKKFDTPDGKQKVQMSTRFFYRRSFIFAQKFRAPYDVLLTRRIQIYLCANEVYKPKRNLSLLLTFFPKKPSVIFWTGWLQVYHWPRKSKRVFSWSAWTSVQVSQHPSFGIFRRYIEKNGLLWA